MEDFGWVEYLEREQGDKPRYIPYKEDFLKFSWESYDDNDNWHKLRSFMYEAFGYIENVSKAYFEIKKYIINNEELSGIGAIISNYSIEFDNEEQLQQFYELIIHSKNNTRMWENKGHTPIEMSQLLSRQLPKEPVIGQQKKIGPNLPCPCGSGKKYKHCCKLIENLCSAKLSQNEAKLFYEIWYKLLDYVNKKLKVVDYKFGYSYLEPHDDTLLHKIRNKLWENPKLITEFINNDCSLSDEEIRLLQSWEKKHIKGRFTIFKYEPEYAVFMQIGDDRNKLYAVKGMNSSISEVVHSPLPILLETVLLPFADKIIYDGYIASYSINFDEKLKGMFKEEYEKIKNHYGIIEKL